MPSKRRIKRKGKKKKKKRGGVQAEHENTGQDMIPVFVAPSAQISVGLMGDPKRPKIAHEYNRSVNYKA